MTIDEAVAVEAEARSRFLLTFTNGWKPGVVATETIDSAESLTAILARRRWFWAPGENSDAALPTDLEILMDHVTAGDPAWLMEPASGDMVHGQPIA